MQGRPKKRVSFSLTSYARRDGSFGLQAECKKCVRERVALWNKANQRQRRANRKNWAKANPEKIRKQERCRYAEIPELWLERKRKYYAKNRFVVPLKRVNATSVREGYAACIATVEEIKSAFTGKCFVCGIPETECNQRLHLDHCHKTGRFRGWLCGRCNRVAGHIDDAPEIALALAMYLENHVCSKTN